MNNMRTFSYLNNFMNTKWPISWINKTKIRNKTKRIWSLNKKRKVPTKSTKEKNVNPQLLSIFTFSINGFCGYRSNSSILHARHSAHTFHFVHHPHHVARIAHHFHHFTHILKLFHQFVDILQACSASFRDACFSWIIQ